MVLIMLSRLLAMQGPLFLGKFCTSPSSLAYRCEVCQSKDAIFFQSRNISKYLVLVDVLLVFAGQAFQYVLLCIRICVYFTWGYGMPGSNQKYRNIPQDIFSGKNFFPEEWIKNQFSPDCRMEKPGVCWHDPSLSFFFDKNYPVACFSELFIVAGFLSNYP